MVSPKEMAESQEDSMGLNREPITSAGDDMNNKLPPYALIIAELIDRPRGGILIRLVGNESGRPVYVYVEIDDSYVAPLTKDEAIGVSERWRIAIPG